MARSKRRQDKKLREREDLIRRSPMLSDGAKILWIELLRGWAWDDFSCHPSQESLGLALGWSVRRVKRRLAELVGFGLLTVSKDASHARNVYTLCEQVPEEICHPQRLINKTLRDCSNFDQGTELSCSISGQGTETSRGTGGAGDGIVPTLGTELSPKDESTQDELEEEDESTVRRAARSDSEPLQASDVCPAGIKNEGVQGESQSRDSSEIDELLLETEEEKPRQRKPRNRRADASLTGLPHLGKKGAVNPAADYVQAEPPPPKTPRDVLDLLRWEIEQKYGRDAAESVSDLTSQQAGQLKRSILSKYSPKVVVGMVRVLVWDWEMAREACWPPRREVLYPGIEHLVQYRTALSGRQTQGFSYNERLRGKHNTYHARYLSKSKTPECDDPF